MTSITVNLTLEQVLEFVQNLPLEYKKAVKQKLEEEKVEGKSTTNLISNFVGAENECNNEEIDNATTTNKNREITLVDIENIQNRVEKLQEDNELESLQKEFYKKDIEQPKKTGVDEEEREQEKKDKELTIEERRAIVESLAGKWKLPDDFDYKEEYRKLIIKKYS